MFKDSWSDYAICLPTINHLVTWENWLLSQEFYSVRRRGGGRGKGSFKLKIPSAKKLKRNYCWLIQQNNRNYNSKIIENQRKQKYREMD